MSEIFAIKKELESQKELLNTIEINAISDEIEDLVNQKLEPIVAALKDIK